MDKLMEIYEVSPQFDEKVQKTVIEVRCPETGELIYRGSNKVIVSGAIFTIAKHWNITPSVKTPTYNSVLGLENTDVTAFGSPGIRREEAICLFAVGTDGCGAQQDQVYAVDYKKWIDPAALVPFRYPLKANDISASLRSTYFGRKDTGTRFAYYFKKFETTPVLKQQYVDGTPIDENIYSSVKADAVEQYVEVNLKITKDDCREWFQAGAGISQARINTISLLTAWPKDVSGTIFYQDIRPLTKFNMPNEALIDLSKGLDIKYQIFY